MYYIASVLIASVVAIFTYQIYHKQIKLMSEQKAIAGTQTTISSKQTDIMQQQNKIALFKERYELYNELLKMKAFYTQISLDVMNVRLTETEITEKRFVDICKAVLEKLYPELCYYTSPLSVEPKVICNHEFKLSVFTLKYMELAIKFEFLFEINPEDIWQNFQYFIYILYCGNEIYVQSIQQIFEEQANVYSDFDKAHLKEIENKLKL